MAIECNQIPQTANYLKQKFASCAKLEAADMDLLVELIEAVNNCGIAGDTTLFSNTVLSGNVFWIENLDFGSTPITYIWNNQIFTAPARPLMTLSDAHATLDRIDVFAVDSSTNSLKIIEGVPAESPQEPTINFETQLRVGAVLIQAGETAPEGLTKELVYDENLGEPTEWATSSPQEGSIVVLDSTINPSNGNMHIYLKGIKDGYTIQFETSSPVTLANISSLSFNFFPKVGVNEQLNLKVSLIDGNNTNIEAGWYIYNNTFGLNVYDDGYHTINATTDQLSFNNGLTTFNIIELQFTSRNGDITNLITEGYIDEVYLTSGFEGYTPGVLRWTELIDTDSNYTGKAGFVPVVRNGEDGLTLTDINNIVSENNKEKVKYILGATRTPDAIAAAINNSPSFTIAKDEIYTFIYNSFNDGAGSLYALMCKIKNYGKGTFGIGGTVLTGQDILIVSGVNSLILDIEESPLTQIINLPASTSTTVEAVFNAQPDFVVQEQNEGYRLVNITIDGNNLQYLFTGIGDTYGATSGNTALSTEFSLLNNTTVPIGIQSLQAGTNITVDDTDPANPIINATETLQDLQSVTDVGNTTTNNIGINHGTSLDAFVLLRLLSNLDASNAVHGEITLGRGFNGASGSLSPKNLTGNYTVYFSNADGYMPMAITDGVSTEVADSDGVIDISALSLGGGNYIPLSGTEVGSPVTGDIEIASDFIFSIFQDGDKHNSINIIDDPLDEGTFISIKTENISEFGKIEIYSEGVTLQSELSSGGSSLSLDGSGVVLNMSGLSSKGLEGAQYYGANYDDNTYVQKKYVDDNFLQGLEIYSESGTLAGGDGVATIGDLAFGAGFTGSGIYYNQDMAGQSLAALSADIVAIMMTNNPGQTMVINDPSNSDNVELSLNGKEVGIGAASNRLTLQKFSTYPASSVHYINYSSVSTVSRTWSLPDATGTIALTEDLDSLLPIETANTGTVISLITSGGNLCNFGSANANTTYTTTGTVLNAYAKVLINTTSEPTITGATKIAGATWVTGKDMYMVVNYTGAARGVEYYFLEI